MLFVQALVASRYGIVWNDETRIVFGTMRPMKVKGRLAERALLPILWSTSSSLADLYEAMPYAAVVEGHLNVQVAEVREQGGGKLTFNRFSDQGMEERYGKPFDRLLHRAVANLRTGLKVDRWDTEDGPILNVRRDGSPAAAAIALPDFHEWASGLLGAERLTVAIPSGVDLMIAAADSQAASRLPEMISEMPVSFPELAPTVLSAGPDGIRVQ